MREREAHNILKSQYDNVIETLTHNEELLKVCFFYASVTRWWRHYVLCGQTLHSSMHLSEIHLSVISQERVVECL